jgi:hypothetical protein
MEELKFVWVGRTDYLEDEDYNNLINYLKELKKLQMINFDGDNPYFVVIRENEINELRELVNGKFPTIDLDVIDDEYSFFSTYFEQCSMVLESSFNKRWNIEVTTNHVIDKLREEKNIYLNEETKTKILTGDFRKELYNLAERMFKDQLTLILSDLQEKLKVAKYVK